MGIAVFPLEALVPELDRDPSIPLLGHVATINVPAWLYPVRYPADDPYHESLSFDPENPRIVYLPFVPGDETLIKLELDVCPSAEPDLDGDGMCGSADPAQAPVPRQGAVPSESPTKRSKPASAR